MRKFIRPQDDEHSKDLNIKDFKNAQVVHGHMIEPSRAFMGYPGLFQHAYITVYIFYIINFVIFSTLTLLGTVLLAAPGPEVIKLFSCSAQVSLKFILLINVKMPTIVGILTFMSRINY